MPRTGIIGGSLGYHFLRWISRRVAWQDHCSGAAYQGRSKLEVLFGPSIWTHVSGKTVLDFGCGSGEQTIEMARHGAKKAVGIDIRESVLAQARRAAQEAGMPDRCVFLTRPGEPVDVILSLDAFEHYADPAAVLGTMRRLLRDDGRVFISFGPPWMHPYGGHQFSVFPWAHLLFTERALIRWRSDIESDGATRFSEVKGGLNQMTIRRFEKLLAASDFEIDSFEAVPIRRLRWFWSRWTREFFTSVVRCVLVPRKPSAPGGGIPASPAVASPAPPGEHSMADEARTQPRVALVAASLDILGGQGVQARALVQGLEQDGYAVRFIPINPVFPRGLRWLRRFRYVRTLLNQALYLPSLAALRGAGVVHVFSASYWSFLLAPLPAMLAARLFGKRVVLHYHSGEAEDHLINWGILVHPGLRLADEIVVPSEYLREVFARHGYRTRVIRNVVDTARFRFRERLPLRPRLLSVRNFERHYRVDAIVQAFALIKARFPDATLTLAGEGSEEESLRRLAALLAPDGVRFIGRVEPRRMPGLYDAADIFVNASVVDNQPVSVLEAFAAGLPVVTTATGDIAAMVRDGETGLIVRQEDPKAMATAVENLLTQPARAAWMARCARAEVERYAWSEVRHAWSAVYAASPVPGMSE